MAEEGLPTLGDGEPEAPLEAACNQEEEEEVAAPGSDLEEDVYFWEPAGGRAAAVSGPPVSDAQGKDAVGSDSQGRAGPGRGAAAPPQCPWEPPAAGQGLCSWLCWRQRVLEHLEQAWAESDSQRATQVTFEDVAVYFSPEEWAELTAWQKALYWEVMEENHGLLASLGSVHRHQSDVLGRRERGEAPPSQVPPEAKREEPHRAPQPPVAEAGLRPEVLGEAAAAAKAGPQTGPEDRRGGALGPASPDAKPPIKREEGPGAAPGQPRGAPEHDCKDCGQRFPEREALISHVLRVHFSERALPCPQCGKFFGSPSSLALHRQSAHRQERVFTCLDCQSHFVYEEQEASRIHAQLARGKLFKCFHCSCSRLAGDQKPDVLHGPPAFGQPESGYYSRQKAMEQVRQRAAHWTTSETKAFVELWGDDRVQTALYDNYRNEVQYKRLSDKMRKMGFHRNLEQCRQRAKDLRRGFKEIKDGNLHSNRARQTLPFFSLLDRFLLMSRGLVVPKVCVNRAKQKGRKTRGRREEPPAGQQPFLLVLPAEGPASPRLHLPDQDPFVQALGLPDFQLSSQRLGLADFPLQLPEQEPSAPAAGAAGCQLRDGNPACPAAGLPDFSLRLPDPEVSMVMEACQVAGRGQRQDVVRRGPLNGLSAASGLWPELSPTAPAGSPSSTTAQTWHPGKAPSSSARRMRDLRLRRRRQRAAMARVLLGANYRPNDRTVWSKTQKTDWWDNLVAGQLDDGEWIRYFRMSRDAVLELVEKLRPVLQREDTNMRAAIPVDKRVALTLWKLATSDSYRSVANQFGVGVSTASVIVMEVCEAIHDVLLKHVVQLGDAQAVMAGFERVGFPNCIGVVDETHIPILCSPHGASAYISGKGLVSMVLQALVDSAGRFMDVYAGWSGGMQDSGLPWGSPLFERMEKGTFGPQTTTEIEGVAMGPVLLGGPACPLRPWLMKPYLEPSSGPREHFNALLSKCRVAVTYAFERLKGRWRCLLKRLDVAEKNVPLVITACCILHNICESRNEAMQEGWEEGMDYADLPSAAVAAASSGGHAEEGLSREVEGGGEASRIREAYCAFFEKRRQEEEL